MFLCVRVTDTIISYIISTTTVRKGQGSRKLLLSLSEIYTRFLECLFEITWRNHVLVFQSIIHVWFCISNQIILLCRKAEISRYFLVSREIDIKLSEIKTSKENFQCACLYIWCSDLFLWKLNSKCWNLRFLVSLYWISPQN